MEGVRGNYTSYRPTGYSLPLGSMLYLSCAWHAKRAARDRDSLREAQRRAATDAAAGCLLRRSCSAAAGEDFPGAGGARLRRVVQELNDIAI
jgi:hypothetical protein